MESDERDWVLGGLDRLLEECHSNVLLALRIIEGVEAWPKQTPEELLFVQFILRSPPHDLAEDRVRFKRWVLLKGFGDVHKAIRAGIERLLISKRVEAEVSAGSAKTKAELREAMEIESRKLHFPTLLDEVDKVLDKPLEYRSHAESFNSARNCLEHANGTVIAKFCNSPNKDMLSLRGYRFRLFYEKAGERFPLEFGKPGPENAAVMLDGEEFSFNFPAGSELDLSLKEFLDVINACVFIRADISSRL